MNRRKYLSIAGASVTAVLSGCGGQSGSDDGLESNTSEDTQTANRSSSDAGPEDTTSADTQTAQTNTDDAESNGAPQFEVISLEVPDEITQPDTVAVELTVANTGDARGTYRGEIDVAVDGVFLPTAIRHNEEIDAGERATLTETLTPAHSGFVTFSIDGIEREMMVIPEHTEPQIQGVELIREWNEYGDVYQNAIDSTAVGSRIVIGVRYWYWHGDSGTLEASVEYETNGDDGSQLDITRDQDGSKRIVRQRGWESRETHIEISTFRWDPGAYTTGVQMRDERTGGVSTVEEATYTLE